MRGRRGRSLVLALGLLAAPAGAVNTPSERVTLAGLTGVHVVFDELDDEVERGD